MNLSSMMYRLNVQHPPQSQQQQQIQTHNPHSSQQLSSANNQHLTIHQTGGGHHLLSGDNGDGSDSGLNGNIGLNVNGEDLKILTAIKSEPMHDLVLPTVSTGAPGISVVSIVGGSGGTVGVAGNGNIVLSGNGNLNNSLTSSATSASTSANSTNGHLVFVPTKRVRIEGPEDWISSPSPNSVPSSAPPLSPSPGSQSHNYNTNMSNGYASPMSTGSYDPYSPNGKMGESTNLM